ncbi:S-4TM family putative pore-forming effector [Micromonospora sp. NPDC048839]|uniref:S-4TM family putative pore-forming effector n=1 Tax=Micromonospora sp. NPDC048839 TaxID=3155641 RepID=UPI0033FCDA32
MNRQTPVYRPRATSSMLIAQDDLRALRLLVAQRRLYNRAKRWSFLRWVGFSIIGVAAPILTVIVPKASVMVGALAGVWIFLSRTWFSGAEQRLAAKAAGIQEQFDQLVFGMPEVTRAPSATMEEVATLVGDDAAVVGQAEKEALKGWYPFDDRLDGMFSIAIAQRANAAYSERLLNANAQAWISATLLWVGVAVIAGLMVGLSLPSFLLGVALPLLPALLDVWEQYRSTKRAGAIRRSMAEDIERFVRGQAKRGMAPEDLLLWQDRLYELRRGSPQVPNLVYKRTRARNEQAMKAAAAELADAALRSAHRDGTLSGGIDGADY